MRRKVDVRIIAATNKDLGEAVKNGSFRNDLYYRISVVPLFIPPLRDRRDDIPILAQYFLASSAKRANKDVRGFTPAALHRLVTNLWPGNVRELENAIEKAVVMSRQDMITPDLLPVDRHGSRLTDETAHGSEGRVRKDLPQECPPTDRR